VVNYTAYLLGLRVRVNAGSGEGSAREADDGQVVAALKAAVDVMLMVVDLNSAARPRLDVVVEASAFYATTSPAAAEALGDAAAAICTRAGAAEGGCDGRSDGGTGQLRVRVRQRRRRWWPKRQRWWRSCRRSCAF